MTYEERFLLWLLRTMMRNYPQQKNETLVVAQQRTPALPMPKESVLLEQEKQQMQQMQQHYSR